MSYFNDLVYVCAPSPLQIGVAQGILELGPGFYQKISNDYIQKRDLLCGTLKEAGLTPSVPKGAYYVLADASAIPGRTSKEKSMALLKETGVASVAGSAYYHGADGENLLRFCFAKTDRELEEACRRLRGAKAQTPTGSQMRLVSK
jgi:aminotransferase